MFASFVRHFLEQAIRIEKRRHVVAPPDVYAGRRIAAQEQATGARSSEPSRDRLGRVAYSNRVSGGHSLRNRLEKPVAHGASVDDTPLCPTEGGADIDVVLREAGNVLVLLDGGSQTGPHGGSVRRDGSLHRASTVRR